MSLVFDVTKWAEKSKTTTDRVIRGAISAVCTNIVKRTPVKEGIAKGNWFATISQPSNAVTNVPDKNGAATIKKAQSAISQAPGNVFYYTNNLPYIEFLEYGGSKIQAPNGMVRLSVSEFKDHIEKQLRK